MRISLRGKIAAGAVFAAIAIFAAIMLLSGRGYKRRELSADSADVQEALQVLRAMASKPDRALDYASADAKGMARSALGDAAGQMSRARAVELKAEGTAWFGPYLRLGVTCPMAAGKPFERYFYLKREGGALRLTGVER
jgi:hypothetical protein